MDRDSRLNGVEGRDGDVDKNRRDKVWDDGVMGYWERQLESGGGISGTTWKLRAMKIPRN